MTKEEILQSIGLKKRFCKDRNLPINLFDEPYFMQRLLILDPLFTCSDDFELFCSELAQYNNEQDYFEYYNSVKDNIINKIKANPDFIRFQEENFDRQNLLKMCSVQNHNLYSDENDGKMLISIDMKKANFSALRHYSPNIFDGKETWEEYVGEFTNSKHIKESKYIRQVILGACNPKRQIKYESYLMLKLFTYLMVEISDFDVLSISNDEIIIVDYGIGLTFQEINQSIKSCPDGIGSLVRCELFRLTKVGNYGWMKKIYQIDDAGSVWLDEIKFKGIQAEIYHQIVKHFFGGTITEDDLVFRYNGQLARFLKEVDNPWK